MRGRGAQCHQNKREVVFSGQIATIRLGWIKVFSCLLSSYTEGAIAMGLWDRWNGRTFVPWLLFISGAIVIAVLIMQPLMVLFFRDQISVLFPAGWVAVEERNLLYVIQAIMLLVIIPVYVLTFIFSWNYAAHNSKAKYEPDIVDNIIAECVWWGLPCILTIAIAVVTWVKTEQLDPFKPLESDKPTITIQVVALDWKWLFIYPDAKVASVNFVQFPANVPVRFQITADAPMNSFWIPHLGGQIYAMPNMITELNLIADVPGEYRGSSANFSGKGFAGMHFIAKASSAEEYEAWVKSAQEHTQSLNWTTYSNLALQSVNDPVQFFKLDDASLFDQISMKYMHPHASTEGK